MSKRFIIKTALFLLVLPFVLELSVRVFAPQQLIRFDNIYVGDDGLGRVPAANINMILNTGERDVTYITDEHGYRVSASERNTPERRILALGDSFTVAMQVEYEQSFVGILEVSLSEQLGQVVQIDNAASANFDMNGYRLRLERIIDQEAYDLGLVFIYVGNDVVQDVIDNSPANNPAPPPVLRLPRNLSRREIENAIFFPINNTLETSSHLFVLFKDRASALLARLGLSRRSFPDELLRSSANDDRWQTTGNVMAMIQEEANQHNIPIVFVLIPSVYQIDPSYLDWAQQSFNIHREEVDVDQPSRHLMEQAQTHQVDMINLVPVFQRAYEDNVVLFGRVDTHLSPEGHQLVVDNIEAHIRTLLMASSFP